MKPEKYLLLWGIVFAAYLLWAAQSGEEAELDLQLILVSSRSQANEILQRLKSGETFDDLAQKHSVDPTASGGGYLRKVKLSALRPEIREALRKIAPGELAGVIATTSGYMILKVLSDAGGITIGGAGGRQIILPAAGIFRASTGVSGIKDMLDAYFRLPKPAGWPQDLQMICDLTVQAVRVGMQQWQGYLTAASIESVEQPNFQGLVNAHHNLGQLWSYQGNMDKAIQQLEAAYDINATYGTREPQLDLEEKLGIAYLHRAYIANSVNYAHGKSCIFPVRPEDKFRLISDSETATKHFLKYLDRSPEDYEVKWLLNLAYMTLGRYPEGVPKQHLIPPSTFESKEDIGRFEDVAAAAGLDRMNISGGAIAEDFDNDGFLDIVTSSLDTCVPIQYLHNNGDGTFGDRTSQAGLLDQLGGLNIVQADYNNDGCMDILVLRGAWEFPMRKSLLRNNCDGTFADVARESGLASPATKTQAAAWADIDNDGNLDLFVGNEGTAAQLFLGRRDGTFTDIAAAAGVDRIAFVKGVAAGDYDNDGYPDFYLSTLLGDNFLYRNNRDRTFTEVARQLRVETPIVSFPCWFFDYDNDGWLDIFVSSYYPSDAETVRSYLRLPVRAETLKLYRNTGKGSFVDVTREVGLDYVIMTMGSNFGDVDNDGFLDLYLGTGAPSFTTLVPNVLYRNHGGRHFVDITASSGTGTLHKGHGVAFADINNDGTEEIFHQVGGAVPGDYHRNMLFKGPGNGSDWITIRAVGTKTNRGAIGARIRVEVEGEDRRRRSIHRVVSSGGSFGASPLQQHIGLGKAARIETLEIWWPTSNTRQVFHNLGVNQFVEVREFEKNYTKLKRRSFRLRERPGTRPTAQLVGQAASVR